MGLKSGQTRILSPDHLIYVVFLSVFEVSLLSQSAVYACDLHGNSFFSASNNKTVYLCTPLFSHRHVFSIRIVLPSF